MEERLGGVGSQLPRRLAESHLHTTTDILHGLAKEGVILQFEKLLGEVRGGSLSLSRTEMERVSLGFKSQSLQLKDLLEGNVRLKESGLLECHHPMYSGHYQIKLEEGEVNDVVTLWEVGEQ